MSPPRSFIAPRPALPIAICLILGISSYTIIPDRPTLWLLFATAGVLAAAISPRRAVIASISLATAAAFVGLAIAQLAFFETTVDDIATFTSDQPTMAVTELWIDQAPTLTYPPSMNGRPMPPKQSIVAKVIHVQGKAGWIDASGTVLLQLSHPSPWLALGQRIKAVGMLQRMRPPSNPGEFDWTAFYRKHGIIAQLLVGHGNDVKVLEDRGPTVFGWLREEARHLLSMGFTARRMTDYALVRTLVLGDSDPGSRDVHNAFTQIGIAYQMAVSGMHIALLAGVAYLLCKLFFLSPRWTIVICASSVAMYALIALQTLSAMRAVLILLAFLFAPLLSRTGDKLQLLSVAAIAIVLISPLDITTAGFQLGFVTVLGLSLYAPMLLAPINVQLNSAHKATRFDRLKIRAMVIIRVWLTLSVIAWFVSLPLVAVQFGTISPWEIAAGLIMLPLVSITLIGGWLKMLFTLLWPSTAGVAARIVQVPSFAMRVLAIRMTHLPGASVVVPTPPTWVVILYYVLLAIPLLRGLHVRWKWWLRGAAMVAGLGVVLGLARPSASAEDDDATVTLLDVGAGQCCIVEIPHDGVTLIDCGSDSINDVARVVLMPFLQSRHDSRIHRVLLSHSDYDHISALSSLIPMLNGPVYLSEYFPHFAEMNPPAGALLRKLNDAGKPPTTLHRGDHLAMGAASLDVLWPGSGLPYGTNDTGLVVRLTVDGHSILFPADIQANAMRDLLNSGESLHADVLVAAHHGSSEKNTGAFVKAVDPKTIVASNSLPLTMKQKVFDQIVAGRALLRTSRCGAITIHLRKDGIRIDTFRR